MRRTSAASRRLGTVSRPHPNFACTNHFASPSFAPCSVHGGGAGVSAPVPGNAQRRAGARARAQQWRVRDVAPADGRRRGAWPQVHPARQPAARGPAGVRRGRLAYVGLGLDVAVVGSRLQPAVMRGGGVRSWGQEGSSATPVPRRMQDCLLQICFGACIIICFRAWSERVLRSGCFCRCTKFSRVLTCAIVWGYITVFTVNN